MRNKSINHIVIELSNNKKVNSFLKTELEKAERKRTVELISNYLINMFHIPPYDKGLVFLLCNEFQKNNKEALNVWIINKLSKENMSDVDYWKNELERVLSVFY